MLYDAIDHVILPVPDPDAAAAPFERLGLTPSAGTTHLGRGTRNRGFFVGAVGMPFYVELLGITDREEALRVRGAAFVEAAEQGRGQPIVMLRTERLDEAVAGLTRRGAPYEVAVVRGGDGAPIARVAWLPGSDPTAVDVRLVEYGALAQARLERITAAGWLRHDFPLKRLDHLAAVSPDLEAQTRYWTDVLGVPMFGEVRTPVSIIRQFKVGDAIIELLGPATDDSPLRQRPPGLVSMCAFEVADLDDAVARARAAGFTPSEPRAGSLPGTRVATIPAEELSGMALQLLQYV
jgi:catechol 2,3-dioxygenase-like lactoylglutathione lyase family enzyme